jgi:hypothetical protein
MSGLTWLRISDWLSKREKEFDRQVVRAALIRDMFLKNFRPRSRSLLDPRKRYTEKSEGKSKWREKSKLNYWA